MKAAVPIVIGIFLTWILYSSEKGKQIPLVIIRPPDTSAAHYIFFCEGFSKNDNVDSIVLYVNGLYYCSGRLHTSTAGIALDISTTTLRLNSLRIRCLSDGKIFADTIYTPQQQMRCYTISKDSSAMMIYESDRFPAFM